MSEYGIKNLPCHDGQQSIKSGGFCSLLPVRENKTSPENINNYVKTSAKKRKQISRDIFPKCEKAKQIKAEHIKTAGFKTCSAF